MSNLLNQSPYQKGERPAKSPLLRNASRGQTCTLQIPGVCQHSPEFTVGAHFRAKWLSGGAQKPDDLFLMDVCSACHAVQEAYHGDPDAPIGHDDILRALTMSQMRRRASGLIILKGEL